MKQKDIQKCIVCGEGVMHTGLPMFTTITLQRWVIDGKAIQRQNGLEQFFGGGKEAGVLASVMGPDEDMFNKLDEPVTGWICTDCTIKLKSVNIAEIHERLIKRGEEDGREENDNDR